MTPGLGTISVPRTLLALGAALAGTITAGRALGHGLTAATADGAGFDALLHLLALAALTCSSAYAALLLVLLLRERRHDSGAFARLCPGTIRPVLVAVCGASAALVAAAPVSAAPGSTHGVPWSSHAPHRLPSLDRPLSAAAARARIVVQPKDTLWSLARAGHHAGDDAATARRVETLYRANRDVIGPDPDLIRPGEVLRRPLEGGDAR